MQRKTPPPPPQRGEKRRHARFELYATLQLASDEETYVLYARNLSLGGVLVDTPQIKAGRLSLGSRHDVVLFDAADEKTPPVRLRAEVARVDRDSVGLSWVHESPDSERRLTRLFMALQPRGGEPLLPVGPAAAALASDS